MNTIKIADRCGSIDIASRARAAQIRAEVVESSKAGRVVLDFAGVRTISGSFADELFAVLAADNGEEWFREYIQVINLDDCPRETIREAIAERLAQPA